MAEKIDIAAPTAKRGSSRKISTAKDTKSGTRAAVPVRRPGRHKANGSKATRVPANGRNNLRSKLKEQKQNFIQGQILEVVAELIAASGFRAVTIDEISATLGVSKSVIYYYLESKNDILWQIFGRIYEACFEALIRGTQSHNQHRCWPRYQAL